MKKGLRVRAGRLAEELKVSGMVAVVAGALLFGSLMYAEHFKTSTHPLTTHGVVSGKAEQWLGPFRISKSTVEFELEGNKFKFTEPYDLEVGEKVSVIYHPDHAGEGRVKGTDDITKGLVTLSVVAMTGGIVAAFVGRGMDGKLEDNDAGADEPENDRVYDTGSANRKDGLPDFEDIEEEEEGRLNGFVNPRRTAGAW